MRILAIGNSYSDDTTALLRQVAAADGVDITAVNLYEGGCSLEKHMQNIRTGAATYGYEVDGVLTDRVVTAAEGLSEGNWDVITIQQASRDSGKYESYHPYTEELVDYIRSFCPNTPIWFHQTWAYEKDFSYVWFEAYGFSQAVMHEAIVACTHRLSRDTGLPLIRTGEVLGEIRRHEPFIFEAGGMSLHRDSTHLGFTYGRLAGALSYYAALTGRDVRRNTFLPEGADPAAAQVVREAVWRVYQS